MAPVLLLFERMREYRGDESEREAGGEQEGGLDERQADAAQKDMAAEVDVPAIAFGPVDKGSVDKAYADSNDLLEKYNIHIKIKQPSFTYADSKIDEMEVLGNGDGTIKESELDSTNSKIVEKLIATKKGRKINGQSIRKKTADRYGEGPDGSTAFKSSVYAKISRAKKLEGAGHEVMDPMGPAKPGQGIG